MQMKPARIDRFSYHFLKMQAVLLLAVGNRSGALLRFDQMLQLKPADRYALASRAHVQAQLNHLEEAIASLQQLSRIMGSGSQAAAAWFNLGYLLQQAGRHEDAGPAFRSALEHDPRMDRAWYGLALVLIHQRHFPEAVEALKKNTALQPMSPYGWYRLAQVRLALGQTDKALKVIEHLRQFEPKVAAQLERENELGSGLGRVATASMVRDAAH
jgi:tetratricopeptide (TPR) repeat protein